MEEITEKSTKTEKQAKITLPGLMSKKWELRDKSFDGYNGYAVVMREIRQKTDSNGNPYDYVAPLVSRTMRITKVMFEKMPLYYARKYQLYSAISNISPAEVEVVLQQSPNQLAALYRSAR